MLHSRTSDVWQLDPLRATLQTDALAAKFDPARPLRGLHDVVCRAHPVPHAELLGPRFPAFSVAQPAALADCYIRGADLVVTYAQRPEHPVRLQAYWRALSPDQANSPLAGVDLFVSVQTSVLAVDPAIEICTRLPGAAVAPLAPSALTALGAADSVAAAPTCWLCRLPDVGMTYVAMCHPADVTRDTTIAVEQDAVTITHYLFARSLEKGVILRGRARGVFVPAANDVASAAAAYTAFLATDLPLTT